MRKRRAQGQQAAASGAFSWVVFYAFRSLFWRGLDNLSRLPADHSRKALSRRGFHRPKCVDGRRFQRRLYVCVESFKSRAIFYIRHITSPYYILLFIGCAGNDVICVLGSFYNSFSEKNCRMEAAGVTEELKARDPMRWVGLMNTLKAQAEEIIQDELIYK